MNADQNGKFETEDDAARTDKEQARVAASPEGHAVSTPLALVMGRLGVADPAQVVIGQIAAPRDEEDDQRFFAWVRVTHGVVMDVDAVEAEALRVAGADVGEVPRCPACGEVAEYERPIDLQRDAWACADDAVFIYAQGRVQPATNG